MQGYDQGPPRAMFEDEWIDIDERTEADGGIFGSPEDPDDDYVDDIDTLNTFPDFLPRPRKDDGIGNHFVTIVDVSGVHYLPVVLCDCQGSLDEHDQYLNCNLFPASFKQIRTAFTTEVLKDFRLSNLECKTTAYQYYSKLRRITCPAFPKLVINCYRELRRLSRQFRNLKLWKMHGRGHTAEAYDMYLQTPGPEQQNRNPAAPVPECVSESGHANIAETESGGSHYASDVNLLRGASTMNSMTNEPNTTLALFCPTCPQPGINLPIDWEKDSNKWLYT